MYSLHVVVISGKLCQNVRFSELFRIAELLFSSRVI